MVNPPKPTKGTSTSRLTAPRSRASVQRDLILGDHPAAPHPFAEVLIPADGITKARIQHRALTEKKGARPTTVRELRRMLVDHHASPDALRRSADHLAAIARLGLGARQARLRRFPTNPSTQKGNLAEVILAEYVAAATKTNVPVYRLRYNPNVDQSMKGDDVLAFDLDAQPVRIVVGEAKFRGTSSAAAVEEIVSGLMRSHKGGIPVSLQFVAERLFEVNNVDLATKVLSCARLFALGQLQLDYVGMLVSDLHAATRVESSPPTTLRRLAIISFAVNDPDSLVDACFKGLD